MVTRKVTVGAMAAVLAGACAAWTYGQQAQPSPSPAARESAPVQVAGRTVSTGQSGLQEQIRKSAQQNEHPLMPIIRWAYDGLADVEKIKDYSCVMVKRERIDGKLTDTHFMFVKIRQKPFSVYMRFLKPDAKKGQECIWWPEANKGKLLAHGVGLRKAFGTVRLDPNGPIAMEDNRYPITEIGLARMIRRLIEVGEKDAQYGECEVKFFQQAKINNRVCTCIQVVHPTKRANFLYHIARIFIDDELNVPVRFECYEWPTEPGGPPVLVEEYTYVNLKFNQGFTDADFDTKNPNYDFPRKTTESVEKQG